MIAKRGKLDKLPNLICYVKIKVEIILLHFERLVLWANNYIEKSNIIMW